MDKITNITELKFAIELLQVEQDKKWLILKDQFHITYDSIKPVVLIKSSLKELVSSPLLFNHILSSVIGLATGYLSKKIVVGSSVNIFRRLIGSVVQQDVTNIVSQHPDVIKLLGQFLIQTIFRKKDKISSETSSL